MCRRCPLLCQPRQMPGIEQCTQSRHINVLVCECEKGVLLTMDNIRSGFAMPLCERVTKKFVIVNRTNKIWKMDGILFPRIHFGLHLDHLIVTRKYFRFSIENDVPLSFIHSFVRSLSSSKGKS